MPLSGRTGSAGDVAGHASARGAKEMIDVAEKWADVMNASQPAATDPSPRSDSEKSASHGLVKWVDVATSS